MGVAHHSSYPVWLEMGRTELCRAAGITYRDLEARDVRLAVIALAIKYRRPALYDDVLVLETTTTRTTRVKLEHSYRLLRDGIVLAIATTTLACLDAEGRPRAVPDVLAMDAES
jgi:acyl-CoA thioester hydrolase